MLPDDDAIRLRHMLEAAQAACRIAAGRVRADLDADETLRLALTRAIEIVGEAAAHVSAATRVALPAVPWPVVVGMRHRLVHAYFDINLDILWRTIEQNLPPLIVVLERALAQDSVPSGVGPATG